MTRQFLRIRDVCRITGVPKSTLYEMMKRGEFPRSFSITPRLVAWDSQEIAAWQREKISQRVAA